MFIDVTFAFFVCSGLVPSYAEEGNSTVLRSSVVKSTKLSDVTSQKTQIFIVTATVTSNINQMDDLHAATCCIVNMLTSYDIKLAVKVRPAAHFSNEI